MKHIYTVLVVAALIVISGATGVEAASALEAPPAAPTVATSSPQALLTHQQLVWEYALEFCESGGEETEINPKDTDGTPSYYSYQFKPSTFTWLEKKYGVTGPITSWVAQHTIVEDMILDKTISDYQWRHRYFPGCVAKLGTPPST